MKATNNIRLAVLAITICVASTAMAQTTYTYRGARMPQLSTTDRALIGVETNADKGKGQQIFNLTTGLMEYWDGAKWVQMSSAAGDIKVENGISLTGGTLKLGGALNQKTTINLSNYNLIFNRTSGNIGIGTTTPKAPLHIAAPNDDPLILSDIKKTSDPKNEADAANVTYYDLKISDAGVIRKSEPIVIVDNPNESFTYNLRPAAGSTVPIATGDASGNNGTQLNWSRGSANYDYVTLPEDGAYVFSFRFYGTLSALISGSADGYTYYLSAFKNGTATSNLFDIAELVIHRSTYNAATYSINMTVAGKTGDKIYFKMASLIGTPWTLVTGAATAANRTSMIFWRL